MRKRPSDIISRVAVRIFANLAEHDRGLAQPGRQAEAEKGEEKKVVEKITARLHIAAIYINYITNGAESEK